MSDNTTAAVKVSFGVAASFQDHVFRGDMMIDPDVLTADQRGELALHTVAAPGWIRWASLPVVRAQFVRDVKVSHIADLLDTMRGQRLARAARAAEKAAAQEEKARQRAEMAVTLTDAEKDAQAGFRSGYDTNPDLLRFVAAKVPAVYHQVVSLIDKPGYLVTTADVATLLAALAQDGRVVSASAAGIHDGRQELDVEAPECGLSGRYGVGRVVYAVAGAGGAIAFTEAERQRRIDECRAYEKAAADAAARVAQAIERRKRAIECVAEKHPLAAQIMRIIDDVGGQDIVKFVPRCCAPNKDSERGIGVDVRLTGDDLASLLNVRYATMRREIDYLRTIGVVERSGTYRNIYRLVA